MLTGVFILILYTRIMEYTISRSEILRRKKAYLTLSTSIMFGLVISSYLLNYPVSVGGYMLAAAPIILLGILAFRFFKRISQTKIYLSSQEIERRSDMFSEKHHLNEVSRVYIKWTANKSIREIYIFTSSGKSIYFSALANFENFKNDLLKKLNKDTKVIEIVEPIDFDHPLFYSLLGLPISAIGVFLFRTIPALEYKHIEVGMFMFTIYLIMLGAYFIWAQPISRRTGRNAVYQDYIVGGMMIFFAFIILIFFKLLI